MSKRPLESDIEDLEDCAFLILFSLINDTKTFRPALALTSHTISCSFKLQIKENQKKKKQKKEKKIKYF